MLKNKKIRSSLIACFGSFAMMTGFTSYATNTPADVMPVKGEVVVAESQKAVDQITLIGADEAKNITAATPDNVWTDAQAKVEEQNVIKEDEELLASIIFCEAGNQPYEGQVAVGAVIVNRIKSGSYPNTLREVLYQSGQFGPAGTGWLDRVYQSQGYTSTALEAARDALRGESPIGSLLHFNGAGSGMKIGDHYFY